jgi:UDPglucose--hexose-1-phosphate uridylyltransferase
VTERRYDPTTARWRILAAQPPDAAFPAETDKCPLCPTRNPARPTRIPRDAYSIVVLDEQRPPLSAHPPVPSVPGNALYAVRPSTGAAEVVVYADRHGVGLADLPVEHVARLVDVWADRYAALATRDDIGYVLVFEDRGGTAGPAGEHPHGRIHGYPDIPPLPDRELAAAREYRARRGTCVFCDVTAQERADGVRLVGHNDYFVAYVPFAARAAYEVHVVAHRHATCLLDLSDPERLALAHLVRGVLRGYDTLFGFARPYLMALHQAPTDDERWLPLSHFHIEFTPGGDGAGGGPPGDRDAFGSDVAPEDAAARLRRAIG